MLLEDYLKNLKEEEEREEVEETYYEDYIYDYIVGYSDEYDKAEDYFFHNNAPIYCYCNKVNNKYFVYFDHDYSDTEVVDTEEEAIAICEKYENSLLSSIEQDIEEFEKELKAELGEEANLIYIEAKRENSNSGHQYSFNIFFNGNLVIEGCFELDQEIIKDLKDFLELKKYMREKNIYIDSIKKTKDAVGFSRYYEITFSYYNNEYKEMVEETEVIEISPMMQGKKRSLKKYIEDYILASIVA